MFTGYQTNVGNASTFDGSIVIFENRPFAITPVANPPYTTGLASPRHTRSPAKRSSRPSSATAPTCRLTRTDGFSIGYGAGSDRTVLLRWPNILPDPVVKAGDWIADVTYERQANVVFNPQDRHGAVL